MSKPVKELVRKELKKRLGDATSLAVLGFTGVDATTTNRIRNRLAAKQVRVTVVKNALAKQAFKEMNIEQAGELLEGPCALAYGGESVVSVVRELLDIAKDVKALQVKGALMEGALFKGDQIEALSKYPTRSEAISNLVAAVLSPGRKLAACLLAPGSKLASILKTIEEKALAPAQPAPAAPAAEAAAPAAPEAPAAPATPA